MDIGVWAFSQRQTPSAVLGLVHITRPVLESQSCKDLGGIYFFQQMQKQFKLDFKILINF